LYKLINWYSRRFKFPHYGWKLARWWMKLTGVLNRVYTKKLHNGYLMQVNPTEHIQQQLFWYGYYEKEVIQLWESFTHADFTVLDIGANTGYYSLIAAKRAKQVYAFEPSPAVRQQLEKNIGINNIQNITVEPYAVSDTTGSATLYISANDNSGMTGMQPAENFSGITETVSTISIDEWIRSNVSPTINAIKIDVEGAELKVLEGMKQLLERDHPPVFIEVVDSLLVKYNYTPSDIYQFFESIQYAAFEIDAESKLKKLDRNEQSTCEMVLFKYDATR
jgi:FkbM family methyltransferase